MDGWRAAARFLPTIVHALDRFQCICHECARNSSRRLIYNHYRNELITCQLVA